MAKVRDGLALTLGRGQGERGKHHLLAGILKPPDGVHPNRIRKRHPLAAHHLAKMHAVEFRIFRDALVKGAEPVRVPVEEHRPERQSDLAHAHLHDFL